MIGETNSNEMGDLSDQLSKRLAPIERKFTELTKKSLTSFWQEIKLNMATASEPFFRKDMGERYFSLQNLWMGAIAWGVGTVAGFCIPFIRSPIGGIFYAMGHYKIAAWVANPLFTTFTGLVMVLLQIIYGMQSLNKMEQYRQDCIAYHTRSRGSSRWDTQNVMFYWVIFGSLLLFNFPVFVLFMISHGMAAKIAAERDAAIYSRYFDMLDQQIENEYLEKAILGQCPTEITQLSNPLPVNLKEQYRKNVAAAATGKPVKIVAKAPESTGRNAPSAQTGQPASESPAS